MSNNPNLDWEENSSLLDKQRRAMKEQDQSIDALSHTVARVKDVALSINDELEVGMDVLDDLGRDVRRADSRVQIENRRIDRFERKTSTTVMWVIIMILFLVILVLVILRKDWFV
eukprot:TRINITY_DN12620_c0_g1_i1.p1 TRINITY_DN12620_c0_g1~~TRINITY_DN12620_c0_g1_i1.p1  ORF type:complete len:129 (-),score=23.67 TRINITY_DN12620_c0_g1_i1:142-486(-)